MRIVLAVIIIDTYKDLHNNVTMTESPYTYCSLLLLPSPLPPLSSLLPPPLPPPSSLLLPPSSLLPPPLPPLSSLLSPTSSPTSSPLLSSPLLSSPLLSSPLLSSPPSSLLPPPSSLLPPPSSPPSYIVPNLLAHWLQAILLIRTRQPTAPGPPLPSSPLLPAPLHNRRSRGTHART